MCQPVFEVAPEDCDALSRAGNFSGKPGQVLLVTSSGLPTLLVGIGAEDQVSAATIRDSAAAAATHLKHLGSIGWDLRAIRALPLSRETVTRALAEGSSLGGRRSGSDQQPVWRRPDCAPDDAWQLGRRVADAVTLARDLVNCPPNILNPSEFARRCVDAAHHAGLEVTVRRRAECEQLGLGGILAIGQGSSEEPLLIELSHKISGERPALSLVGKGVTFDSGGLSLKSPEGMIGMKHDMAGAATVLAAMTVLPHIAPGLPVKAFLPVVENMPGPRSARPGDVVTMRNGRTVEILNTDFEGRVILADALALAAEESPSSIIDVATLTHAAVNALGDRTAALLGNDAALKDSILTAADASNEPVWPLPMPAYLRSQLLSDIADLKNYPGVPSARALTAAMFLSEFVPEGIPWAHLDIAGPAWADTPYGVTPTGGTGFGVRLLTELFTRMSTTMGTTAE